MESENAPVEPQPKRGYVMIDVILKSVILDWLLKL